MNQQWFQNFNPLGNTVLSTIAAAIPVCTLFFFLGVRRAPAWKAAIYGFVAAVAVALAVFRMPPLMVAGAVADGLVFGLIRIAWLVVGGVFIYNLSVESGQFETIKQSITGISGDRRLQVLLVAFAFGALIEGAGGGGAPVAVTAAMMVGMGFPPFQAAVMCLIANSAPVAFGGIGNPVRTLVAVTQLPEADFSAMLGRILPLTTLILPFWIIRVMAKTRDVFSVWPGLLACGVVFGGIQLFWSNCMDASLPSIAASIGTIAVLAIFFRFVWHPKQIWRYPGEPPAVEPPSIPVGRLLRAWSPFILLAALVVLWGVPSVDSALKKTSWAPPVPGLAKMVVRPLPIGDGKTAEKADFDFSLLANPGTATVIAGFLAGPIVGLSLFKTTKIFVSTLRKLALSLLAIMAMIGIGYVTRYCGMDATMGLAMAYTGRLFPFFGTLIGWLGVAISGTDAGSNALFGSLQKITAIKLGLSPILMGAANSAGGVMGKMMSAQSLVIACAATGQPGKEGQLFRALLKHSVLLALIVGLLVMMFAYVFPGAIPSGHHYW